MTKNKKTGLTTKHWIGYMCGDWGGCMTFTLLSTIFSMFCTNALGIDPGLLGTLVIITGRGVDILRSGKHHKISYMCGSTSEDFGAPMLFSLAKKWCDAQEKPSYTWMFDRRLPGDGRGAWHSSDLWYWFGTLDRCWRPMEKKDYSLSEQLTDYLTNFAKSGDPNRSGLPMWAPSKNGTLRIGEGETDMGKVSQIKLWYNMFASKSSGE